MGPDVLEVTELPCVTVNHATVDQLVKKNVPAMVLVVMGHVIAVLKDGGVPTVKSKAVQDGVKTALGMATVFLQPGSVFVGLVGVEEAVRYLCVQEVVIVATMEFVMG